MGSRRGLGRRSSERAAALVDRIEQGDLGSALVALGEAGWDTSSSILGDVEEALALRVVSEEYDQGAEAFIDFFALTRIRTHHAESVVSVRAEDAMDLDVGERNALHIWPDGPSCGETHPPERLGTITLACGEEVPVSRARRGILRGHWRTAATKGSSLESICPRCAELEGGFEECQERQSPPLLARADLAEMSAMAASLLRERWQSARSKPHVTAKGPVLGVSKVREATRLGALAWASERLARDGELAMTRIFGSPTGFERFPSAVEWQEILGAFRPTKSLRAHSNSVAEAFRRDVKTRLWRLDPS